jgi:opacity protein-like surface antigen
MAARPGKSRPDASWSVIEMRKFLLAAAALTAFSSAAKAAHSDNQLWSAATATIKLDPKWRLSQDIWVRFSDNKNGLYEIEANSLVGYVVGKGVTVWGGYTHDPQYAAGHFTTLEQRAREQVTFDNLGMIGPGKLSGRMRAEQRWRRNAASTAWRLRPYLKYALPIGGKVSLNLSNETFVDLNTTTFQKKSGVDRMRNLISLSLPLSKRITGEAGYMNQYIFVHGAPDEMDHIAYFTASLNL